MNNIYNELQPKSVFKNFKNISDIPRESGNMIEISNYLVDFGRNLNLVTIKDKANNVLIRKPATKGYEKYNSVILQAHIDMVCEEEDYSKHNFLTDPIELVLDGDVLKAKDTTLGADNGLGVAYMMAILESTDISHPEIEALFTTDEETTMLGVLNFDYTQLKSKNIINFDSYPIGVCGSGELEMEINIPYKTKCLNDEYIYYNLSLEGLLGGHSGQNATEEKGNANTYLNRVLYELNKRIDFELCSFSGGNLSSAISRTCRATIAIKDEKRFKKIIKEKIQEFEFELRERDPNVKLIVSKTTEHKAIDKDVSNKIIDLVTILPDGVFTQNLQFKGFMESCCNIGIVKVENNNANITLLIRSVDPGKKYYLRDKVETICKLVNVDVATNRDIAHWTYNVSDEYKKLLESIYSDNHMTYSPGTLECGPINNAIKDSCAIAIGAPYYNAHSPREYCKISEIQLYWEKFIKLIQNIKNI